MKQAQKLARIVVPLPLKDLLTYRVPESMRNQIAPGSRVLIPLQRRILTGIVLDFAGEELLGEMKSIIDLLDDEPILDHQLLKLGQWASQYYLTSLGEVLATMLPPNSRRQGSKTVVLRSAAIVIADELSQNILSELKRKKGKLSIQTLLKKFAGLSIERPLARL